MNPIEECRRKADQIVLLGGLPHDHGHPHFLQSDQVIRFQRLIDNFQESDPALVVPGVGESGIERDMQYLINREMAQPDATILWSEQGFRRHSMWRILRVLAREALVRAGVQQTSPSVEVNELCSR